MVLELNGTHYEVRSLPANKIPIQEAAFSADKEKVLYISGGKIYLQGDTSTIDLNIGYTPIWHDSSQVILQWSQSGESILVYGIDMSGKYCAEEKFQSAPCWQVINAVTGEHVWWESEPTNAVAALSPDGKQVARSMYVPGNPNLSVSYVDIHDDTFILDSAVSALHWSSK